ncbi:unnamed protein product [Nippostrongylus brasiliensis]|uniref:Uncharacterized protein n=1 Tax=Nippostrongylus brasiliensis TaxID=27835 RepID=A0A0N4YQK4_NIPBR|nr:unnamed protein product [Nippostrongylus brasiliensis]
MLKSPLVCGELAKNALSCVGGSDKNAGELCKLREEEGGAVSLPVICRVRGSAPQPLSALFNRRFSPPAKQLTMGFTTISR